MTEHIPIVSVVGRSDSGKTGLLETLIGVLTSRGHRVATVRHHVHDEPVDVPGKDSSRHGEAGATVTMVSGPVWHSVVRRVEREATLDELAREAGDVDILLTEGYKDAALVRIETHLAAQGPPLFRADDLFALVTDGAEREGTVPTFGFDEAPLLAELIEHTFLGGDGA